ncbi:hypothetical protein EVG20_g1462 [Dentipellis fragilis]|uniref:Uncharacterized protein n=1 Tax=Dentipellis fragilis TaxID=205917 RepID=A0A4Y9Z9M2_9AGAM|nr:hypothetical protein EVG20_g1462 [Dentipellis fragilis]
MRGAPFAESVPPMDNLSERLGFVAGPLDLVLIPSPRAMLESSLRGGRWWWLWLKNRMSVSRLTTVTRLAAWSVISAIATCLSYLFCPPPKPLDSSHLLVVLPCTYTALVVPFPPRPRPDRPRSLDEIMCEASKPMMQIRYALSSSWFAVCTVRRFSVLHQKTPGHREGEGERHPSSLGIISSGHGTAISSPTLLLPNALPNHPSKTYPFSSVTSLGTVCCLGAARHSYTLFESHGRERIPYPRRLQIPQRLNANLALIVPVYVRSNAPKPDLELPFCPAHYNNRRLYRAFVQNKPPHPALDADLRL